MIMPKIKSQIIITKHHNIFVTRNKFELKITVKKSIIEKVESSWVKK